MEYAKDLSYASYSTYSSMALCVFPLKHTDSVIYADDNTLCAIANSLQADILKLVTDGSISFDWFTHDDRQDNPSKFHFIVTSSCAIQLTLRTVIVEHDDYQHIKLLVVNIDKKFDFMLVKYVERLVDN